MKSRSLILGFVLALVATSSATAFDGNRKGFVLGGGLGLAPVASWSADLVVVPDLDDAGVGLGAHFLIGYAWDNFNMIVYEGNGAAYNSGAYGLDFTAAQGFNGVSWYHYFGPAGETFFSVVGLGAYVFRGEFDTGIGGFDVTFENDPGGGILIGGGAEFLPHWQVGLYVSAGKTEDRGVEFDHYHINMLFSGVAF